MSLLFLQRTPRLPKPVAPVRVSMEMVGCPASGKTALLLATVCSLVGHCFPSGLYYGADPQLIADAIAKLWKRIRDLRDRALQSTLDEVAIDYTVSDGDIARIKFATHECRGQTLTETTPQSKPEEQARYRSYLQRLAEADVLWIIMAAPPPNPSKADRLRFDNHLRLALAYLQISLQQRTSNRPCNVAGVLTKIDGLFDSAEQAREALTDDYLASALKPFVQAVRQSNRVREAVLVPTTAFGWGNAELVEEQMISDDLLGVEPTWILRNDAVIEPDNIGGLMAWTLLSGILPQEVTAQGDDEAAMAKVARMLSEDLSSFRSWLVPVKGQIF